MTRVPDYPQLRQFFEGYLHEDFMQEHRSPQGALRAFEADASAAELRRFRAEAEELFRRALAIDQDNHLALRVGEGERISGQRRRSALMERHADSRKAASGYGSSHGISSRGASGAVCGSPGGP